MTTVLLKGEELEVARAEVEAVRAAVGEGDYADLLDDLLDVLADGGRSRAVTPTSSTACSRSRSSRAASRALRTGRRAGRAARVPEAADRGRARSATAVNEALASLGDRALDGSR